MTARPSAMTNIHAIEHNTSRQPTGAYSYHRKRASPAELKRLRARAARRHPRARVNLRHHDTAITPTNTPARASIGRSCPARARHPDNRPSPAITGVPGETRTPAGSSARSRQPARGAPGLTVRPSALTDSRISRHPAAATTASTRPCITAYNQLGNHPYAPACSRPAGYEHTGSTALGRRRVREAMATQPLAMTGIPIGEHASRATALPSPALAYPASPERPRTLRR